MCAKTIFGANKRITPGGFIPSRRKSRKIGNPTEIKEAANQFLADRSIRELSFGNHDILFGKRKP